MGEHISELLKANRGPGGDLYLPRSKTERLLRWVIAIEDVARRQEKLIEDLKALLKSKEDKI